MSSVFWGELLGGLATAVALTVVSLIVMRPAARLFLAPYLSRLARDDYRDSLLGVWNLMRHVGGQTLVETLMRATSGEALSRPMGSPRSPSPWDDLLLQPVSVAPHPPAPDTAVPDTTLTVGPQARHPLVCAMPILVGATGDGGALATPARMALAAGATRAGTAICLDAPLPAPHRDATRGLVRQMRPGVWNGSALGALDALAEADAVEIRLGPDSPAVPGISAPPSGLADLGTSFLAAVGAVADDPELKAARLLADGSAGGMVRLVQALRARMDGPVGARLPGSSRLEQELEVLVGAGVDFVTVEGVEGGARAGAPTLQDDVGLPTLYAVVRADRCLRALGARERVTLLAIGQLVDPGRILKAIALGADGVYTQTAVLVAAMADQMKKTLPWEPPFDLVLRADPPHWRQAFDVDRAAGHVAAYLRSTMAEVEMALRALGKSRLRDLSPADLVALRAELAAAVGVAAAWAVPTPSPSALERLLGRL